MNTAAIIKNIKQAEKIKELVSVFLVPINDLSINYENTFSLEEIKEIIKIKPAFIIINKNIHNNEIDKLKEILVELENIKTEGIIFYDIAIVNLKKKLKLNYGKPFINYSEQPKNHRAILKKN